jgi:CBS domain-containing protein
MASISKGGGRKAAGKKPAEGTTGPGQEGRLDVEADSRLGVATAGRGRGLRVEEIMSTELVTAAPDTQAAEAARLMRDHDVGFLPVCQSDGSVVGVLTDRDLVLRILAEGRPATTRVDEIMSEEVAQCHAADDLAECERLMRGNQVTRMLVLGDQDDLVGVVSLADLANHDEDDMRLGSVVADVKTTDINH